MYCQSFSVGSISSRVAVFVFEKLKSSVEVPIHHFIEITYILMYAH